MGLPEIFVFDISEAEIEAAHEATELELAIYKRMKLVHEIYKKERDSITVDMQISEEAFNRLLGRPGFSGDGWSRLVRIVENGEITFHIIPSASTNVAEIKKSGNPERTELILSVLGLNVFEGRQIRFSLVPINGHDAAEIEDRSEIYPWDLVRVGFIPNETAGALITL